MCCVYSKLFIVAKQCQTIQPNHNGCGSKMNVDMAYLEYFISCTSTTSLENVFSELIRQWRLKNLRHNLVPDLFEKHHKPDEMTLNDRM